MRGNAALVAVLMLVPPLAWGCEEQCRENFDECPSESSELLGLGADPAALDGARIEVCVDASCAASVLRIQGPNVGRVECDPEPLFRCALGSTAEQAKALRIHLRVPTASDGEFTVMVTIRIYDPRMPAVLLSERSFPHAYRVTSRPCGTKCIAFTAPGARPITRWAQSRRRG